MAPANNIPPGATAPFAPPPLGIALDQVMIDLTKQDLEFKREMVKQLKETDDDQKQQLKAMTETVGSLSKSISEGFLALTSFLNDQNTPSPCRVTKIRHFLPCLLIHSYLEDGGNTYFTFQ